MGNGLENFGDALQRFGNTVFGIGADMAEQNRRNSAQKSALKKADLAIQVKKAQNEFQANVDSGTYGLDSEFDFSKQWDDVLGNLQAGIDQETDPLVRDDLTLFMKNVQLQSIDWTQGLANNKRAQTYQAVAEGKIQDLLGTDQYQGAEQVLSDFVSNGILTPPQAEEIAGRTIRQWGRSRAIEYGVNTGDVEGLMTGEIKGTGNDPKSQLAQATISQYLATLSLDEREKLAKDADNKRVLVQGLETRQKKEAFKPYENKLNDMFAAGTLSVDDIQAIDGKGIFPDEDTHYQWIQRANALLDNKRAQTDRWARMGKEGADANAEKRYQDWFSRVVMGKEDHATLKADLNKLYRDGCIDEKAYLQNEKTLLDKKPVPGYAESMAYIDSLTQGKKPIITEAQAAGLRDQLFIEVSQNYYNKDQVTGQAKTSEQLMQWAKSKTEAMTGETIKNNLVDLRDWTKRAPVLRDYGTTEPEKVTQFIDQGHFLSEDSRKDPRVKDMLMGYKLTSDALHSKVMTDMPQIRKYFQAGNSFEAIQAPGGRVYYAYDTTPENPLAVKRAGGRAQVVFAFRFDPKTQDRILCVYDPKATENDGLIPVSLADVGKEEFRKAFKK